MIKKFNKNITISVIGLGYVGLPLALEFSNFFKVVGVDSKKKRIIQLKKKFKKLKNISFKNEFNNNYNSDVYIVAVPTPLDKNKKPDLTYLIKATNNICKSLKPGNIIVYESTVYPGATEEILIPLIKKKTNLFYNKDFFIGYTPERINPGDKKNKLTNIKKIISGGSPNTLFFLKKLYEKIIKAGVHSAPNIKVAEAAKILENVQRDINISLMNEAALIFDKLNIDISEVLKASRTKWNFLDFKPGLVGGHCISVDPYYLKYRAEKAGYSPKVISSGRNVNEKMASYIVSKILRNLTDKKASTFIMGVTYKENCSDLRNSQVLKILEILEKKKMKYNFCDPYVKREDLPAKILKHFITKPNKKKYDVLILAVPHKKFLQRENMIKKLLKKDSIVFDVSDNFNLNNLDKSIKILKL